MTNNDNYDAAQMLLRNGGIYQTATVQSWLAAKAKIAPDSKEMTEVMQGLQPIAADGSRYRFEPLQGETYKVHFANAREIAHLVKALDQFNGMKQMRLAFPAFCALMFMVVTGFGIAAILPGVSLSRAQILAILLLSMIIAVVSGYSFIKR